MWTRPRWVRRDAHLAALDLVAAVVVLVALAPPMRTEVPVPPGLPPDPPPPGWLGPATWSMAAGVAVPVMVRRSSPLPAFGVMLAAATAGMLFVGLRWPGTLAAAAAMALTLYSVAATTSGLAGPAALVTGIVLTIGGTVVALPDRVPRGSAATVPWADAVNQVGLGCLLLVAAWAVGLATRRQRMYAATAADQAARDALIDERRRIARELHDIVAHSMSLIAVKAGIANHVADARPQEARAALHLIETTSRGALVELRRVLDVLRADTDEPSELDPTPGLAGLDVLVRQAVSAGVMVEVAARDPAAPRDALVPPGVQLSVYRIVQEALTNVVKHAGPVLCRVAVTVAPDLVHIEIANDGPAIRRPSVLPGHGLVGMRERVAAYGGTFTAGPRPGGGYAVRASLPYQPVSG
jgi:signal transduction histidine kinase